MEENAEMGLPATLNRNVPLKQDGNEQWEVSNPQLEWKVGSADVQLRRTSASSESSWWEARCLLTW